MAAVEATPYGSWQSPITADRIVSETIRLGQIALDGGDIYWLETRPSEGGRNVLVRRQSSGQVHDLTPKDLNVRTRAHEYGGGAFCVAGGEIFFCNDADQRIYIQSGATLPTPLTQAGDFRFADAIFDEARNRLVCIKEDHSRSEQVNQLVSIDVRDGRETILAAGNDFYASPALSPDGTQLAWLTWNQPNMPWDGTDLCVADVRPDGQVTNERKLAGGAAESVFQPQWSPSGTLYFITDHSGWWNIYRQEERGPVCVWQREAEFGLPQWIFGMSTYGFESEDRLICTLFQEGVSKLAALDIRSLRAEFIDLPFTSIDQVRASRGKAAFVAGSPIAAPSIVQLNLGTGDFHVLRRSAETALESTFYSRPEAIEFPTENGLTAHAYFYPPQNRDYFGPDHEKPPLIVKSHGGPTAATSTELDLRVQFWTSRGFAILDVNYGGSTGYGRAYRERLKDSWGIVDVDDCVNAAKYVTDKGFADAQRAAIAGGSAGGYTTLCALTFRDFFKAGASYYGISDLEALAKDTHKFEARYLDKLVAPYPSGREVYVERSPIHFADRLSCPVILLQGLDDKVVPPNQAVLLAEALREKGLPVAYLTFAGEQHGFRQAASIKRALEAELYFYSRIFDFDLPELIEPVQIDNL